MHAIEIAKSTQVEQIEDWRKDSQIKIKLGEGVVFHQVQCDDLPEEKEKK